MKNVWEVLKEFTDAPPNQKVGVLQRNGNETLKNVLQAVFHPGIQFVIKDIPKYKKSDAPPGMGYTSIELEMKRIYLFVEGSLRVDPNLTLQRKQVILAQMLEAMEPKEAEVFKNMILKDLKIKDLTPDVVREAFPGLIP